MALQDYKQKLQRKSKKNISCLIRQKEKKRSKHKYNLKKLINF